MAVRYIGGKRATSPYEVQPPTPGGHYAQWVLMLPSTEEHPRPQKRAFWLHFVHTPFAGNVSRGYPDPYTLAAAVDKGRQERRVIDPDAFDRYLYNSIRFEVRAAMKRAAMERAAWPCSSIESHRKCTAASMLPRASTLC